MLYYISVSIFYWRATTILLCIIEVIEWSTNMRIEYYFDRISESVNFTFVEVNWFHSKIHMLIQIKRRSPWSCLFLEERKLILMGRYMNVLLKVGIDYYSVLSY